LCQELVNTVENAGFQILHSDYEKYSLLGSTAVWFRDTSIFRVTECGQEDSRSRKQGEVSLNYAALQPRRLCCSKYRI
jgi:hypothetical protein